MSLGDTKKAKNKNKPRVKCEICNLELSNMECYLSHKLGKKHQKKLKELQSKIKLFFHTYLVRCLISRL